MQNENPVIITEENADGSASEFEITTESPAEGTLIEEIVEALFDDTTPEVTATFSDSDGDGMLDTAAVDSDGDGTVDTVFMDTDGDGNLDTAASDLDGDGKVDMVAVDTDGDGKLDIAVADTDGDGVVDTVMEDRDGDGEFEVMEGVGSGESFMSEADAALPTDEELSMNSVEFNLGSEAFSDTGATPPESPDPFIAGDYSVAEPGFTATSDPYQDETGSTAEAAPDPAIAEQQANADAAREAQTAADEFADAGDYRAAADARADAEALSGEAGDSSMLGAYDAQDYSYAADKQDEAGAFQADQAEKIAQGDYEGARDSAFNAEWATRDADMTAGGADRTGQAQGDQANLEWATYHQEIADGNRQNAEVYAAEGDLETAQMYADNAEGSQAAAGGYADQADPGNIMYDVDHSSAVDTGGSYDASLASVDTGFDSSVDTTPTNFDTSTDDTL